MENTFNINEYDTDRRTSPASFPQCRAIGYKFAKDAKTGKMNWLMQKRITAQMFDLAKVRNTASVFALSIVMRRSFMERQRTR